MNHGHCVQRSLCQKTFWLSIICPYLSGTNIGQQKNKMKKKSQLQRLCLVCIGKWLELSSLHSLRKFYLGKSYLRCNKNSHHEGKCKAWTNHLGYTASPKKPQFTSSKPKSECLWGTFNWIHRKEKLKILLCEKLTFY